MTDEKRPYRKRQRAQAEEQTRRRITESTVELHERLGPSGTSISAIAERAGVRRSTVYRHFPDEFTLFAACSSHWLEANPPPDVGAWAEVSDPDERLSVALAEMYPYYRRCGRMLENLHRDEETMPVVKQIFSGFRGYVAGGFETLMVGRRERGARRRRVEAAVGHALAFTTWRSLAREQGLDDGEAAELMRRMVSAAARS